MADQKIIDIRRLASLLNDPDEAVAVSAMAELLNRESELGDLPAELQENASHLMRRRIHQLQSALTMIERRRFLAALLRKDDLDFIEALIQIHLQWFDRDSELSLHRRMSSFIHELEKYPRESLADIGDAFAFCGVTASPVTTLKVEQYCLGSMLDDRCGAAALWCGIICGIFPDLDLSVIRFQGRFAVRDNARNEMLIPENNWQTEIVPGGDLPEEWPLKNLLRLAVMTLFSAAVNSDSFRYILTLAQAFTGSDTAEPLGVLPYPYNPEIEPLS